MMHRERRRIVESLVNENLSFSELLKGAPDGNHGKFGFHLRALKDFVEFDASTKKYRLTDRGELLASSISDLQFKFPERNHIVDYARQLKLGDHAVGIYDSEDFRDKMLIPFFEAGLSENRAVMYFTSENRIDSATNEIQKYGIDLDGLAEGSFTIMSAYEMVCGKRDRSSCDNCFQLA